MYREGNALEPPTQGAIFAMAADSLVQCESPGSKRVAENKLILAGRIDQSLVLVGETRTKWCF